MNPGDTLTNVALKNLQAHPNWYIFPIRPLKKDPPCIKLGVNLEQASNDLIQIRKWYSSYRGCNWGLALKKSKVIVLDGDMKPGKVGEQTLENLFAKHGALPPTFIVRTPSGGFHFYFDEANGVTHKCRLGKAGFGVDVDSPNYVLLPGCVLDEDPAARQTAGIYEAINDERVAPSPDWFGLYLRDTNQADADQTPAVELDTDAQIEWAKDYLKTDAPPAIMGKNGENTLLMVAGVLKDRGISESLSVDLLLEFYNPRCEPQWGAYDGPIADRLDVKVHNAWLYLKQTQPGAATAAAEFGDDDEPSLLDWGGNYEVSDDGIVRFVPSDAVIAAQKQWRKDIKGKKEAAINAPGDESEEGTRLQREAAKAATQEPTDEPPTEPPSSPPPAEPDDDDDESWLMGAEEDVPAAAPVTAAPEREPWDDDEPSTNTPMIPLNEIDESVKPDYTIHKTKDGKTWGALTELCNRWVWVTGIKRFVNRLKPTMNWEGSQFDSAYNYLCPKGTSSISRYLFKRKDILRRFDVIAFRPGRCEYVGAAESLLPLESAAEYNVWRPSPIIPAPGDTMLWEQHLEYLFPDPNDRNAVLNWMAWVVQNPTRKPNHALLVVGRETGTGKSWVARVMEQIIGENNTQRPKNSSMGGDFNSWLKDCRLCLLEEVMQVGRRENINAMRDLITETSVEVNMKGVPAFKIPNYAAMFGVTNHTDALPVDDKDRRWFIIETRAQTKAPNEEAAYYAPLLAAVPDEPGMKARDPDMVPAIYQALLDRKIDDFPLVTKDSAGKEIKIIYNGLSRAPWSAAKDTMIELSRTDAETWLHDNIGNAPLNRDITTVNDIAEYMPASIQRTNRLTTAVIPNFLRDKRNGLKLRNQVRLSDGRKVHLWVLGNVGAVRYDDRIIPAAKLRDEPASVLAKIYEAQRKTDNKKADTTKEADFGVD